MAERNCVVTLAAADARRDGHEFLSRAAMARRIAGLLGYAFAGEYAPGKKYTGHLFFVPQETLVLAQARRLGVRAAGDLYGGVVPQRCAATKAIVHRALDGAARLPRGWPHALGERVRDLVLPGWSVFDESDARRAGRLLLASGRVRIKPAHLLGGAGQFIVADEAGLDAAIAQIDPGALHDHGAVVEQNVDAAEICSIGEVALGGRSIAYCGVQRGVADSHGAIVYGGSDLQAVRGALAELLHFALPPVQHLAIRRALEFDRAASEAFPGFFASRRNYDVLDANAGGRHVCAVLEQSWRIGGASPAELAAFAAFAADPTLNSVRASTHEVHGDADPPPGADIYFDGIGPHGGRLLKYSVLEPTPVAADG